jgi:hypothetical protein
VRSIVPIVPVRWGSIPAKSIVRWARCGSRHLISAWSPSSPGDRQRAAQLIAIAADDDDLPAPTERRLKAYGFIGAAQQIGMAWLDGHLPLTIDEVIDQLVDMFTEFPISPRPHRKTMARTSFTVGSWLATGHKRLRPRRGLEEPELR